MTPDTPLIIHGGQPLRGTLAVQPSKNAALPIIVASLLTSEPVTLHGIPRLRDIHTLLDILSHLGTRADWVGAHSLRLHTPELTTTVTPHALVGQLRASITLLGALLSRAHEAHVGVPGGCTFSERPVDQHVKALTAIGVNLRDDGDVFHATRPRVMHGSYLFELLTVGGTQNAVLAAVLGEGEVTLEHCSPDTDVVDMVNFLNSLGADIRGAGTPTITIRGVPRLHGGEYRVIPDRLEAGTFMIAAVATRGQLTLTNVNPAHLRAVSNKLTEMGVAVTELGEDSLHVDATQRDLGPVNVTATEYPGFPTDLQPIMSALLATVPGTSVMTDRIYARTTHVPELLRMGASIELADHVQVIRGTSLRGTSVRGADIRSGAALVVAALAADGETVVDGVRHLSRGYEDLAARLASIGADIRHAEPEAVAVPPTGVVLPVAMD
ncbi:UDP-N-acetylglucosamine 1-carboxyvinyltransferase [Deinococcus pimensis]|uniref:UDP-N-acetylglucosamine 1-carboxyvinyltransferase n=1 Tax=Deinococcus pimensis TaxID=309888 RepID=UPI0004BA5DF1|nr:UDP-N-acetylglucosamine 1-carboxyvinyltransferase [Deinococcus pimensis]